MGVEIPPHARARGYTIAKIAKNGHKYWGNGKGAKWAAWPEERDAELRRLHKKGLNRKVIARALDISMSQLDRRITRLKLANTSIVSKNIGRAHVSVRLTAEEKAAVNKLAYQSNTTPANYFRILIRRAIGFNDRV